MLNAPIAGTTFNRTKTDEDFVTIFTPSPAKISFLKILAGFPVKTLRASPQIKLLTHPGTRICARGTMLGASDLPRDLPNPTPHIDRNRSDILKT